MSWVPSQQLGNGQDRIPSPHLPTLVPLSIVGAIILWQWPHALRLFVDPWLLSSLLDRGHQMGPSQVQVVSGTHPHQEQGWPGTLVSHVRYRLYCFAACFFKMRVAQYLRQQEKPEFVNPLSKYNWKASEGRWLWICLPLCPWAKHSSDDSELRWLCLTARMAYFQNNNKNVQLTWIRQISPGCKRERK